MVPLLDTARLRLRAFRADDFDRWSAVLADPAVYRWLGGTASGLEETWRRVLASTGSWIVLGYGSWAVEATEDGRLVGQVGFADFRREMTPSIAGIPEMGWIMAPDAHGKGYASEAVRAGLAWIDVEHRPAEVTAIIDPGNAPSIRVAEKAGFSMREEAVYRGAPILLFRRRAGP